eukprot:scaffold1738_cov198-Skeletonema_marinoi.AAC.8
MRLSSHKDKLLSKSKGAFSQMQHVHLKPFLCQDKTLLARGGKTEDCTAALFLYWQRRNKYAK